MRRLNSQFSSIRTEGGLLPQDLLSRIQTGDPELKGLDPQTYHLAPNERIGEAVNRSWNRMLVLWHVFHESLEKESESSQATGITRERWLLPLFQELGYGRLQKCPAMDLDGKSFAVSHAWHLSPIHLMGCRVDLDRRQSGVAGAARSSPHGLVQEFLNRSEKQIWGFVSNGYRLRILRDHHSLTRQAYVEFDIQSIMDGEQYSEFLMLWMLCHQSRVEAEKPEDCWLETWFKTSRDDGIRALDKLRNGVEKAIKSLGSGFLSHRSNGALRSALETGDLDKQNYYRQVLRLVYRIIFLFVAEERDGLLDPNADDAARIRYDRFYSLRRIRELADRKRGGPHGDIWHRIRLVMDKLDDGCPELALPALGSRLWSHTACSWLMKSDCSNEHLLDAIRNLSHIQEGKTRYSVNWRNVGADELGSVYESLLELHPRLNKEAGTFELDVAAGHERKTTGSYYTPSSLVDCLLDSALDPVIDEAVKKPDPEKTILELKVCDPACGSGHFLVAAARRLAKRLATVRSGDVEPSPGEIQKALRDIVGRCIYGVDINPMAVELCKVSLWMEALEPGKPLSFLDHRIRCGNSLLGATPALLEKGIPDGAFNPVEGDDKKACTKLKNKNKTERQKAERLLNVMLKQTLEKLGSLAKNLDFLPDNHSKEVKYKAAAYRELQENAEYQKKKCLADIWCAAFFVKKFFPPHPDHPSFLSKEPSGFTTETLYFFAEEQSLPGELKNVTDDLSAHYGCFHWQLEFPEVFVNGGFDCVIGNPPWERIKLQEKEWFSERSPEIASASNAAARKRMIEFLADNDPELLAAFHGARREQEIISQFLRESGRYPLCGRGDVNTYTVFTELNRQLIHERGRVGCIVPSGIATDDTTKMFFQDVMDTRSLISLYDFENRRGLFPAVDSRMKFCLLTTGGSGSMPEAGASFLFFAADASEIREGERVFTLTADDIKLINPNTRTCPIFRNKKDYHLGRTIYEKVPCLITDGYHGEHHQWRAQYLRFVDYGDHAQYLHPGINASCLLENNDNISFYPVYEAKLIHQFNHRYATYKNSGTEFESVNDLKEDELHSPVRLITTRFSITSKFFKELTAKPGYQRPWFLVYRDITNATNERTCIATAIPFTPASRSIPVLGFDDRYNGAILLSNMNSYVFDYCARQKMGGTHMTFSILSQLPILPPEIYNNSIKKCIFNRHGKLSIFIITRALELSYTAWDLLRFSWDCNYVGPPFVWDEKRRTLLRCELDALYFHLYKICRGDVDYIMETFPIVKRKDIAKYGSYRTKETILEIYDAMQIAMETGQPYQTRLDPPPGPPTDGDGNFIPMDQWDPDNWPPHIHRA